MKTKVLCLCGILVFLIGDVVAGPFSVFGGRRIQENVSAPSNYSEKEIDEAARRLERWRELPAEQVRQLSEIVDSVAVKKAVRQEWSLGSCGMVCQAHGSKLYNVAEDGTVTLVDQGSPAPSRPSGGYGRLRLFRR